MFSIFPTEQVESGLVSVGGDRDDDVGGIKRHQLGVIPEGDKPSPMGFRLEEISSGGAVVGKMTNCVWPPRM